jgi:hypothetical protein
VDAPKLLTPSDPEEDRKKEEQLKSRFKETKNPIFYAPAPVS